MRRARRSGRHPLPTPSPDQAGPPSPLPREQGQDARLEVGARSRGERAMKKKPTKRTMTERVRNVIARATEAGHLVKCGNHYHLGTDDLRPFVGPGAKKSVPLRIARGISTKEGFDVE